jgi:hypothetical protein
MRYSIVFILAGAYTFLASVAQGEGWGALVNRSDQHITVDLINEDGITTSTHLKPDDYIQLVSTPSFTARIRNTAVAAKIDASRTTLGVLIGTPYNQNVKPARRLATTTDYFQEDNLSLRYYQVISTDEGLKIVRGYSYKDVEEIIRKYNSSLEDLGISESPPPFVSPAINGEPSNTAINSWEKAEQDNALYYAIAKLRLVALVDAISKTTRIPWKDGEEDTIKSPAHFFTGNRSFMMSSLKSQNSNNHQQSEVNQEFTLEPCVSEESESLLRRLFSNLNGERFTIRYGVPASAPGPAYTLQDEFTGSDISQSLLKASNKVIFIIQQDKQCKRLSFADFVLERGKALGGAQCTDLVKRTAWRYHTVDDTVSIVGMNDARFDLRWRLVIKIQGWVSQYDGGQKFRTHVFVETQKKCLGCSINYYAGTYDSWHFFEVVPKDHTANKYDVEKVARRVSQSIEKTCFKSMSGP